MRGKNEQAKFQGVYIDSDFGVEGLNPGYSFDDIIRQIKQPLKKVDLLEENLETLLTIAFQYVFNDFELMLISRQRPLFQVADLIAIDQIGRLTVFEIKKEKPNSVEIVAQATKYLIECANLTPMQIRRLFCRYYANFSIFQVLYFASLLVRRRVEAKPGLRRYLCESGQLSEDERIYLEKLSKKGGEEYFNNLKEKSIQCILKLKGVNINSIIEPALRQVTGILNISLSEFKDVSSLDFDKMYFKRFKVKPENVDINRQWRIIYFAPAFSFEPQIQRYLTEMYLRGMDIHFYKYRLMTCLENGSWLLGWEETQEWLDEKLLRKKAAKSFYQWRSIEPVLDEFTVKMARKGHILKKHPGNYEFWDVVKPDWEEVWVRWPNREASNLKQGLVSLPKMLGSLTTLASLKKQSDEIQRKYNVNITYSKNHYLAIEWNTHSDCPKECVEIASNVVAGILKWYSANRK
jgi:hypothetical protein